jgi:hypothetical protein
MKNTLVLTILLFLASSYHFFAQDGECGTSPLPNESINLNQEGGLYLTAQDTLKVLVVFVRFKDDSTTHPYWDNVQDTIFTPPDNYTTFIDSNLQTNSTHYINLTNYYKQMSLGILK